MDHTGDRRLGPVQQTAELLAIGDVAGLDPGSEFVGELTGARRVRTTAADQQQMPDAVFGDQMPGETRAEPTGTAGDQDRSGSVQCGLTGARPGQSRREQASGVGVYLGFAGGECGLDVGVGTADQDDPARMLGLRGPDQPFGRAFASGQHHQRAGLVRGQEVLQPAQSGVERIGFQDRRRRGVRRTGGERHLFDAVEAVPHRARGRDGADAEPAHGGDGRARAVGEVERETVADRPGVYAHFRRTPRVQHDVTPGERHRTLVLTGNSGGLECGVEQCRVQTELRRLLGLRKGDLGEDLRAATPDLAQAAEHRPIREPGGGKPVVGVFESDGFGVLRRPSGVHSGHRRSAEEAGRVGDPRPLRKP